MENTAAAGRSRASGSRVRQRHPAAQGQRCTRDRQRSTFLRINSEIIAAADTGETTLLVSTVEGHLPQMNVVNISTALHRLAKTSAASPEEQVALRQHPVLAKLLAAACTALLRNQACGATSQGQALSNITWSLATMQLVDVPLLRLVAELGRKHAATFKSFELTTIIWSLAKLIPREASLWQHAEPLFQYASDYIPSHVEEFSFRCLVMTAWSCAKVHHHVGHLFLAIAERLIPDVSGASCQELANIAWAFSTAGVHHDELFAKIADQSVQQLSSFNAEELSSILWSFAASGFLHEALFDSASVAARAVDLRPRQLANILWALSRMRPQYPATRVTVLALLRKCTIMLDDFQPQELSSVVLAVATSFGRGGPLAGILADTLPRMLPFLADFAGQALADVATSLVQLHSGDDAGQHAEVFVAIGGEVTRRVSALESSALLLLLRDLPEAPRDSCGGAVRAVLREVARRIDELQPRELQTLTRLCAGMLGCRGDMLSKAMLLSCCHSLAGAAMWDAPRQNNASSSEALEISSGGVATWDAPKQHTASSSEAFEASSGKENSFSSSGTTAPQRVARTKGSGTTSSTASTCSSDEEVEAKRKIGAGFPEFRWSYCVKNTFVDFDDSESSDDSDTEAARRSLGAPLDIIPPEISLEKLEAYRASYQRFRAGNAVGAKGELANTVV